MSKFKLLNKFIDDVPDTLRAASKKFEYRKMKDASLDDAYPHPYKPELENDLDEWLNPEFIIEVVEKKSGKKVGSAAFSRVEDDLGREVIHPFGTYIDDKYQRQGIGSTLYRAVEKDTGLKVKPSPSQSDAGRAFSNNRKAITGSLAPAAALGATTVSFQDAMASPIKHGAGRAFSDIANTMDKYSARPVRAGTKAALDGKNPFSAAYDSIAKDQDVSGREVAESFLSKNPNLGFPKEDGSREYPLAKPLGFAADMVLDPTNLIGVGLGTQAAKKASNFPALMRYLK